MNRPRPSLMEKIGLPAVGAILVSLWIVTRFFPDDQRERTTEHLSAEQKQPWISIANGRYHLELVMEEDGQARLYTLGADPTQVLAIDQQELTVFIMNDKQSVQNKGILKPAPQPGDPPGKTSCFSGAISSEARDSAVSATIPNLHIHGNRYHAVFAFSDHEVKMPTGVGEKEAKDLYLKPAGKYTVADIRSNGRTTASQKYRGFQAKHDLRPQPGDVICPITQTKANPACTWIIDGQVYQFCCPPCIDEYVRLAKEHPEQLQDPESFVEPK